MNSNRRAVAIILAIALLCGLMRFLQSREPSYQGQSLRYWLEQYEYRFGQNPADPARREAEDAIRHIGTNALPYLLKHLSRKIDPGINVVAVKAANVLAFRENLLAANG